MKKFLKNALAFGLAGVACLSLTACGNDDAAKIEAQNKETFNSFYTTAATYGDNLQALTKNDATNQKQFEFKVKFGANMQARSNATDTQLGNMETMFDLNFEAGLGARTGAENDIYAYINTKNFDGEMTQWVRAYLKTQANDDMYVAYYGDGAPADWAINYGDYYLVDTENSQYVKNTAARYNYYKLYYTYDASTETYTQIFGIPEDWDTNYANYYVMDFAYVANTNPVYDEKETYYQLSDVVYTYFDADTNQYIKFELLTTEPADWATKYNNYYTFDGEVYLSNSQPTFEAGKFYKMVSTLPEFIAQDIYGDDINGKYTLDIPTQIIANTFANMSGSSSNPGVDMGQIQDVIDGIQSIKDYDSFKAQIQQAGATISSTKDSNGATLTISQVSSNMSVMSVNELKLVVSNDGTIKVVLTAKQSVAGVEIMNVNINLEVSMTETFDETKIPTDAELADYQLIEIADIF